jgi:hypothetical protein
MKKGILLIIAVIVLCPAGSVGVYEWQNANISSLQTKHSALVQRVSRLKQQYASTTAAANISTTTWKRYCDQFTPFCFNYPNNWTLTDNPLNLSGDQRDFATITNPSKTIQLSYANPLIKDGGSLSARIVKASHVTIDGTAVALLGIVPVSSVTFQPSYMLLGSDQALGYTPGNNALLVYGSINPRFDVGKYQAISFYGYPTTKITSYAQAQAWFNSIDGKTVAKILESYAGGLSAQVL